MPDELFDARYRIVESLGEGSWGAVYKAEQPSLGRQVAIKLLKSATAIDAQTKERFFREAQTLSLLSHPNLVKFFSFSVDSNNQPYIVMELVEGESLASYLQRQPILSNQLVIELGCQITSAMDYAHKQGVLHRDIKPSNLIMAADQSVKLVDFGLAKFLPESPKSQELTAEGFFVGTVDYISPEQALGGAADVRSEIYSLACVLFEMASGRRPFVGANAASLLFQHVNADLPDASVLNPDIQPRLQTVLERALNKDPDKRYQSMSELHEALHSCIDVPPAPSPAAGATSKQPKESGHSAKKYILGLSLVGIITITGVAIWYHFDSTHNSSSITAVKPAVKGARRAEITAKPHSEITPYFEIWNSSMRKGLVAINAKKWRQAAEQFGIASSEAHTEGDVEAEAAALLCQAQCVQQNGSRATAVELYTRAAELAPRSPGVLHTIYADLARSEIHNSNYAKAVVHARAALTQAPTPEHKKRAKLLLAMALTGSTDRINDEAVKLLDELRRESNVSDKYARSAADFSKTRFIHRQRYLNIGADSAKTVAGYMILSRTEPKVSGHLKLAREQCLANKHESALESYLIALELAKHVPPLTFRQAITHAIEQEKNHAPNFVVPPRPKFAASDLGDSLLSDAWYKAESHFKNGKQLSAPSPVGSKQ